MRQASSRLVRRTIRPALRRPRPRSSTGIAAKPVNGSDPPLVDSRRGVGGHAAVVAVVGVGQHAAAVVVVVVLGGGGLPAAVGEAGDGQAGAGRAEGEPQHEHEQDGKT
jgi:hypothetical protein